MKKPAYLALLSLVIAAGAFFAGYWFNDHPARLMGDARHILYYVDPMHPAYKSDKPGSAPDCGMELVPVYAEGPRADAQPKLTQPSTLHVSYDKQQLIGVRVAPVETGVATYNIRLFGRVVPDETRVYAINAGIDGYIRDVSSATTGSHVRKNEWLATFAAPNATMNIQTYILNLGAEERFTQAAARGSTEGQALPAAAANIQQRTQQLQNLGMSTLQMQEIKRTRLVPDGIKVLAPADGFILERNVSAGERFERGAKWYRIANLKRIWITANVSQDDARYLRPGQVAQVSLRGGSRITARVADIAPQFDVDYGTCRVRLEAENPAYALRPNMFVDVFVTVTLPSAITIPSDAVLDSGLKKTVFVESGQELFDQREVETGAKFNDRVEIVKGLMPGERIAISGNFLLDSESRLRKPLLSVQTPMEPPLDRHGSGPAESQVEKARTIATSKTGEHDRPR